MLTSLKTCLKAKSMVDVTVFISVRFYACMYIFMNTNCRWFYEKCKKNIWENAELKVKKICTDTCGFKFNNKYLGSWIYIITLSHAYELTTPS